MWNNQQSSSTCKPADGFEISVTKWAHCWGWAIDTTPSAVLNMDIDPATGCNRILSMPGGAFLASGQAKDKEAAKIAALEAWKCL